jgi:hypothetical protein
MIQNQTVSSTRKIYEVKLGSSPTEADIAVVSTDVNGSPGELNRFVLKSFGYDDSALKELKLNSGYALLQIESLKPILFIVTVGNDSPINNIRKNLTNGLRVYTELFYDKTIWIPLMGMGAGELNIATSFEITTEILNTLFADGPENFQFIISLPPTSNGEKLFEQINKTSNADSNTVTFGNDTDIYKDFLEETNARAYLVEAEWGFQSQIERFYNEGIWEAREDENYDEIINPIDNGDFLIIKSAINYKGDTSLHLKGMGVVTSNPQNGRSLNVEWIVRDIEIPIEELNHYTSTISEAGKDEIQTIISKLNADQLAILKDRLQNNMPSKPTLIAGLLSDADVGEDQLNITKDVLAFARVIAAKSFIPPLAIALFGRWGSGKSFFMNKLKDRINSFSFNQEQTVFCKGIAQVHFNAWSYMDSNLWASLVTRIFEGLHEYISNDTKAQAKIEKQGIEDMFKKNLSMANEEQEKLKKEKNLVEEKLGALQLEKEAIQKQLKKKIDAIEEKTLFGMLSEMDSKFQIEQKVTTAIANNKTIIENVAQFKTIIPEEYWKTPNELYKQTTSGFTFLKTFFKAGKWHKNLFWLAVIIFIIITVPLTINFMAEKLGAANLKLSPEIWAFFTIGAGALVRGVKVYDQLQPLAASFWKIKEDYEYEKEKTTFDFHQRQKALEYEIQSSRNEIEAITLQINLTEGKKAELEFRIKNTLSTEALYSFIEKRSASKDYKDQLGIISIIRKDFEVLNELFREHAVELSKITVEDSQKFKGYFDKPLERIILYIDDLDRCPEERVVEVLEALNLLMAFPLFVVVVGVDPRWVKNALIKRHQLQFTKTMEENGIELISPSDYLEKIFQIPFTLKEADDKSVKKMLLSLSGNPSIKIKSEKTVEVDKNQLNKVKQTEIPKQEIEPSQKLRSKKELQQLAEILTFTDEETNLIQSMSLIIGSSPRGIKRFVNIYKITKAHDDFPSKITKEQMQGILFLLALPIGDFKRLYPDFIEYLNNDLNGAMDVKNFLIIQYGFEQQDLNEMKQELWNILNQGNFVLNIADVKLHHSFIRRFSYHID